MTGLSSRRTSQVGMVRWLVVTLAVAGVAVLHGLQCAAGMSAPLLAPPSVQHAAQDAAAGGIAALVAAADSTPALAVVAAPVKATSEGHNHERPWDDAGGAAGACLVLFATVVGLLLAAAKPGERTGPCVAVPLAGRPDLVRRAPRLSQLGVLRT